MVLGDCRTSAELGSDSRTRPLRLVTHSALTSSASSSGQSARSGISPRGRTAAQPRARGSSATPRREGRGRRNAGSSHRGRQGRRRRMRLPCTRARFRRTPQRREGGDSCSSPSNTPSHATENPRSPCRRQRRARSAWSATRLARCTPPHTPATPRTSSST